MSSLGLKSDSALERDFPPLDFQYLVSTDERRKDRRILTAANDIVKYEGKNFGDGVPRNLYKYVVALVLSSASYVSHYQNTSSFVDMSSVFTIANANALICIQQIRKES